MSINVSWQQSKTKHKNIFEVLYKGVTHTPLAINGEAVESPSLWGLTFLRVWVKNCCTTGLIEDIQQSILCLNLVMSSYDLNWAWL